MLMFGRYVLYLIVSSGFRELKSTCSTHDLRGNCGTPSTSHVPSCNYLQRGCETCLAKVFLYALVLLHDHHHLSLLLLFLVLPPCNFNTFAFLLSYFAQGFHFLSYAHSSRKPSLLPSNVRARSAVGVRSVCLDSLLRPYFSTEIDYVCCC